jgi:hypothetical protein
MHYEKAPSAEGRGRMWRRLRCAAQGLRSATAALGEAGGELIIRFCPTCLCDTIIGHGRRRKQAHDESHDWIGIRRGLCTRREATFTFLPVFSLPYTHYSLIARSQALRRYFLDHRSWESAGPDLKDPDRIPAPSTLRRWCHRLDSSRPAGREKSGFAWHSAPIALRLDGRSCGKCSYRSPWELLRDCPSPSDVDAW